MSRPVLVTGVSGQVGSAVAALLRTNGYTVATPGRDTLNLADPASIRSAVALTNPNWIVSCAAYTAVDAAETDRKSAFEANAVAPGILAEAAAEADAGLIHFSTDYVFNGGGTRPWVETDETGPLNVYGASKLAGEQAIQTVAARSPLTYFILRTSWVYSGGGKNFVRTMLRLLSSRSEPLRIVADQHGAPTSADDLADAVLRLIQSSEISPSSPLNGIARHSGVYHCAGTGETTWAGLAEAVRKYLQMYAGLNPPEIIPVPSTAYPTPAVRPLNSRLNCDRLADGFGIRLPHWSGSVAAAIRQLAAKDLDPAKISE